MLRAGGKGGNDDKKSVDVLECGAGRFPLMLAVAPLWKPLPRMVRVAPAAAETVAGAIVPIPKGTAAS